jgi:hypothetical protein
VAPARAAGRPGNGGPRARGASQRHRSRSPPRSTQRRALVDPTDCPAVHRLAERDAGRAAGCS